MRFGIRWWWAVFVSAVVIKTQVFPSVARV